MSLTADFVSKSITVLITSIRSSTFPKILVSDILFFKRNWKIKNVAEKRSFITKMCVS
jgi:hypothetical protein